MNISTFIILLIVILLFVSAIVYQIKNKNTCGLGCAHCKNCEKCSNAVGKERV